ncbi:MAG: hypothetical protein A3F84_22885 [Candidatus Handelsmanbacteria bacterium RIFCSPLOWO2_12_FULL_64_10]|uniref:Sodium:dicarboxylate symporter n=1 Tax=Handelsmanbacteria sp. (strain RIFCSPLOWO2_12_FULL_64_10) TaxID=1817868 RepID=A0A1F6CYP0_HANXR|nr:MAG: hypothetical protein A3F84_22885 [Candidatus Handelsmanbacteria bacterium RIFCSPLOWO2_12_FULL_64_10]
MDHLTRRILIGIAAGIAVGLALPAQTAYLKPVGDLFVRLLKMLIAPLILSAIVTGVVSLGDLARLGRMGGKALAYYLTTGAFAVLNGLLLVNLIRPGEGTNIVVQEVPEIVRKGAPNLVNDVLLPIVPTNVFQALADGNVLAIIFFGVLMGAALSVVGDRGKPLLSALDGLGVAMMRVTEWVMAVAPLGVFALMASLIGASGLSVLIPLLKYVVTVLLGVGLHGAVTLCLLLYLVGRRRPLSYARTVSPALTTAFATSSSAATLPVTYETLVKKAGISPRVASFFLPISSMINSDGTAVYEAVAAVFIAQVYGIHLTAAQQVLVFLTAMAASVGAPGIPSAGLVTMAMVLRAVGLPLEGIALLLPVDRILDQFRTACNVFGDCVGAAILERSEGDGVNRDEPNGQNKEMKAKAAE